MVLDAVGFEVAANSIFGFIGLNGEGKTTLIKIILNLLDIDFDERHEALSIKAVEIFGVANILPKSRQKIFYLPEKFQPSMQLKGVEFLKFSQDFYGKKLDVARLEELCQSLDFRLEALDEKVAKYSKGMVQKLGLLAVFLSEAELIILDEPMSGLDTKARINLKRELLKYKSQGKTVFFSSHILVDIEEICDEIAVLNKAKIIFTGSPQAFKIKHREDSLDKAFLQAIV